MDKSKSHCIPNTLPVCCTFAKTEMPRFLYPQHILQLYSQIKKQGRKWSWKFDCLIWNGQKTVLSPSSSWDMLENIETNKNWQVLKEKGICCSLILILVPIFLNQFVFSNQFAFFKPVSNHGESVWRCGHKLRLPPLRPRIESWTLHVGWDLSISIWKPRVFFWVLRFSFHLQIRLSCQELSSWAIKHWLLVGRMGNHFFQSWH